MNARSPNRPYVIVTTRFPGAEPHTLRLKALLGKDRAMTKLIATAANIAFAATLVVLLLAVLVVAVVGVH